MAEFFNTNRTTIALIVNAAMVCAGAFGLHLTTIQMGAVMGLVNPVLVLLAHKATHPSNQE